MAILGITRYTRNMREDTADLSLQFTIEKPLVKWPGKVKTNPVSAQSQTRGTRKKPGAWSKELGIPCLMTSQAREIGGERTTIHMEPGMSPEPLPLQLESNITTRGGGRNLLALEAGSIGSHHLAPPKNHVLPKTTPMEKLSRAAELSPAH